MRILHVLEMTAIKFFKVPTISKSEESFEIYKKFLLLAVRTYLLYFPLRKGKGRIREIGLSLLKSCTIKITSRDKIKLFLSFPEDFGYENICLLGNFETGTTTVLKKVIKEDDVIFDIGANIGYYTTMFSIIAHKGYCHAFEPVPKLYSKLVRNCKLNKLGNNLSLNQLALGDRTTKLKIHTFSRLPHGHSSLSSLGRNDFTTSFVKTMMLDKYLRDNNIKRIDLIKMDVEGAEMMVLEGASQVFCLSEQPIWILEMNKETSQAFGYVPEELLKYLLSRGRFKFYRIKRAWGEICAMDGVEDYQDGDNVLCVPPNRLQRVKFIETYKA